MHFPKVHKKGRRNYVKVPNYDKGRKKAISDVLGNYNFIMALKVLDCSSKSWWVLDSNFKLEKSYFIIWAQIAIETKHKELWTRKSSTKIRCTKEDLSSILDSRLKSTFLKTWKKDKIIKLIRLKVT